MRLPDFIIGGVQRCGTTTLYNLLAKHPQIKIVQGPLMEVHFWDYPHHYERGLQWYADHLGGFPPGVLAGEKSPTLLDHNLAPSRMTLNHWAGKMIFVLRNPTDRAYSHWQKAQAKGFENLPFVAAVSIEADRYGRANREGFRWGRDYYLSDYHVRCYKRRGRYINHLTRWLRWFKMKKILILRSEDLWRDHNRELAKVWEFLGVDPIEIPRMKHYQNLKYDPMTTARFRLSCTG